MIDFLGDMDVAKHVADLQARVKALEAAQEQEKGDTKTAPSCDVQKLIEAIKCAMAGKDAASQGWLVRYDSTAREFRIQPCKIRQPDIEVKVEVEEP